MQAQWPSKDDRWLTKIIFRSVETFGIDFVNKAALHTTNDKADTEPVYCGTLAFNLFNVRVAHLCW